MPLKKYLQSEIVVRVFSVQKQNRISVIADKKSKCIFKDMIYSNIGLNFPRKASTNL